MIDQHFTWQKSWDRCNRGWVSDKYLAEDLHPLRFLSHHRLPILFPDFETTTTCFGTRYPEKMDLEMVLELLDDKFSGDVISLWFSGLFYTFTSSNSTLDRQ
jgi:hypothetical protein